MSASLDLSTRLFRATALSERYGRVVAALLLAAIVTTANSHDVTTKVTWNREISRLVYARCASCHRPGGNAFSLVTYADASPWGRAIRDSVLRRTMPPWGAVKGFGAFRNEQALMPEELSLIENWVNGGLPEGNPNDLPPRPVISEPVEFSARYGEFVVRGEFRFERKFMLDGFVPTNQPRNVSSRITLEFPDGRVMPLVWLRDYTDKVAHPFLLRKPLAVPAGTIVRGLPPNATLTLIPALGHKQ